MLIGPLLQDVIRSIMHSSDDWINNNVHRIIDSYYNAINALHAFYSALPEGWEQLDPTAAELVEAAQKISAEYAVTIAYEDAWTATIDNGAVILKVTGPKAYTAEMSPSVMADVSNMMGELLPND